MSKSQTERLQECLALRRQWATQVGAPFPETISESMNVFVKDGVSSSGKEPFYDRYVEYRLTTKPGKETFVRVFSTK